MLHINGKADIYDIEHARSLGFEPQAVLPCPQDARTGKINPHTTRFLLDGADGVVTLLSMFHVRPIYYEALNGSWRPLYEVAEIFANHHIILRKDWDKYIHPRYVSWLIKRMDLIGGKIEIPSPFNVRALVPLNEHTINFTVTGPLYPDPDPETTTVDGFTIGDSSGDTFTVTRDHAGNGANDTAANHAAFTQLESSTSPDWRQFLRGHFLFDTSAIADGDTISAATWSLKGTGKGDWGATAAQAAFHVGSSAPASNTALVAGDHDSVGSTSFGEVSQSSYSTSAYNDISLTDFSGIDKTGVSKFGTRIGADMDNDEPTHPGSTGQQIKFGGVFADTADVTGDPKLSVTHAASSTFTPRAIFF